ncbi:G-type lectin S-receptor-like serine/threonine-protein kinase SD1-13 [Ziziphus jujuba]|uniref:G-type lectin S-receptor-like serine/threonine-protein kinase SD1-13 n=1 Tax=Ziziphus jujuba TaxID=326968 RepID=A0ABM3ZZD8_ZIZJJ|nr:G-type lectin S-receptor-like serine/threonine-protein kinase SD1-13 [Ziziphus jujuba]
MAKQALSFSLEGFLSLDSLLPVNQALSTWESGSRMTKTKDRFELYDGNLVMSDIMLIPYIGKPIHAYGIRKQYLTSWLSPSDPNKGFYYLGLDYLDMTKSNVLSQDNVYQQIGFCQVGTGEVHTSSTSQLSTKNDDPSGANLIDPSRKKDHELPQLSISSVVANTDHFSVLSNLGEGGFGPVYKLQWYEIAVKRLSNNSRQGLEEFKNEVELTSKLQARNLVKLLDPIKWRLLDWRKRKHIIKGIAQGLLYFHNGYMFPKYAMHRLYLRKSDVFSFRVILLEIVSGRKSATFYEPNCSMNLLVGLLCVQENAEDRPKISDVVLMFSSERECLSRPKQLAYSTLLNAVDGSFSRKHTPSPNLVSISLVEAR